MNNTGFEIERKYLIRRPADTWLEEYAEGSDIVQTYLNTDAPGHSDRVRKRSGAEGTVYTHTEKKRLSALRREEKEQEITEEEYLELLKRADPRRCIIYKRRYVLIYKGQSFEIDVYPFWNDRAVMEIELEDEAIPVELPADISVIKEITEDKRYTNASLARAIPFDEVD